ncbi:hypothetical protein HYG77_39015 (plasmid) [Rhodococcus sp. ZPP]|uniref:hypothetical protein n=1 Tax=Rhodococcus sp. ZPP TaxID=2749906 RepID=UPI001AD868AD|nr:hypothetical protein [Rhodococcus sp. ZPP]QTJ71424.1 hypothetical protein HYG77_39015 [Rhodococcus sp. ZPP]
METITNANSTDGDETVTRSTRQRRFVHYAAVPIAGLAAVGIAFGATGIASAGTLPSTGLTIIGVDAFADTSSL